MTKRTVNRSRLYRTFYSPFSLYLDVVEIAGSISTLEVYYLPCFTLFSLAAFAEAAMEYAVPFTSS